MFWFGRKDSIRILFCQFKAFKVILLKGAARKKLYILRSQLCISSLTLEQKWRSDIFGLESGHLQICICKYLTERRGESDPPALESISLSAGGVWPPAVASILQGEGVGLTPCTWKHLTGHRGCICKYLTKRRGDSDPPALESILLKRRGEGWHGSFLPKSPPNSTWTKQVEEPYCGHKRGLAEGF